MPAEATGLLQQVGHDVVWDRTDLPCGMNDVILQRAQDEERLVVTSDLARKKGLGL